MSNELVVKTARASELKIAIEDKKRELETLMEEFTPLQQEILNILEATEIDSVETAGFKFYIEEKSSVKIPRTVEDKQLLFDFLKSKELFDEIVSVNSQTLNSLYRSLSDQAMREGKLDFQIPGVEEPKFFKTLKMRKCN